ncbi:MAG: dihydroorotase [Ruminococcaceae bacterium]|nr:dihydroorotase [Oscillospiraceae bacterium]
MRRARAQKERSIAVSKLKNLNLDFLKAADITPVVTGSGDAVVASVDHSQYVAFPGFCDVHVHFREPGFSYKETIKSGSLAAARGGFTAVCTMPNLSPVPDSVEHLNEQLDIIKRDAVIRVVPCGSITVGEKGQALSDMEGMAPFVVGYSDDGVDVRSDSMMRAAMEKAKVLDRIIVAHCEIKYEGIGYIHDGEYARANGHRGITSESEFLQVARDIALAKETGCAYHVCHISTKESVALIREAKKQGVNITCETGPHYLLLDDSALQEHGRFKMNPPLRSKADREALVEGLLDGTIDMIATDHAPHAAEEKAKGLAGSSFGVVGIETSFPLMYTGFVKTGLLTMEQLIRLMCDNPRRRFGLPVGNDFSVWDLNAKYTVDPKDFLSMGKATPFEGVEVYGKNLLTVHNGQIVYKASKK